MKIRIHILLLFFVCGISHAQEFKKHILFLASESMHGRAPATNDEKNCAEYISGEFKAAGCASVLLQEFPYGESAATNVIGFLDFHRDSTILICAHYDHLGEGSGKSKEILKKGIHPGADDNASGVAMMIELAKSLSRMKDSKYNFVFAGFSAHEAGLLGSGYFCNSEFFRNLKTRAVINFDMVGRLDKSVPMLRVSGVSGDPQFSAFLQVPVGCDIHLRFNEENILQSDLKPFAERKIPVLNFTTGIHDDYHKMSDTEDKINYSGMNEIYILVESLLRKLNAMKN